MPRPSIPLAPGPARGAWIGLAVTAGWLLNDAARYATSGQPSVFLALVPGSLVALGGGALLGALAGRFAAVAPAAFLLGTLAFVFPGHGLRLVGPLLGWGDASASATLLVICQGKTLAGWSAAWLAACLARRAGLSPARAAVCLGVLAAIGTAFVNRGEAPSLEAEPYWKVPAAAAALALLLGAPRVPWRAAATSAVVLGAAALTAREGFPMARASYWRDDLPPPAAPASGGPNLLLVVLDTLRARSLAPYGYGRVTTPELDAWVREHATLFSEARSTSSFTLATHGSLFTGVLPGEHQAARLRPNSQPLSPDHPTLAERLRERGYQTAAIVSNRTYLHPDFGMDRGFEHFDCRDGSLVEHYLPLAQLTGRDMWAGHLAYRHAGAITDAALAWLERRRAGEPFFLMLNYLDAHTPYLPHPPHDMEFEPVRLVNPNGVPVEHRALAYDRSIHYLDSEVARLLRGFERHGLVDDTLIVITSDHGEAFGEHGLGEHCWTLYEEVLRVPLYVKPAGGRRAERDERLINSADLMWLMLEELGIEHQRPDRGAAPFAEWYRQVPLTANYVALGAESRIDLERDLVAWFEEGRKVIVSTEGTVEAFDLDEDPLERRPLELSPAEVERALARARAWWQAHPLPTEATEVLSPGDLARMRALGYAGE